MFIDHQMWLALPAWAKFAALALGYRPEPIRTRRARASRASR